jgi:hypothetical protein
MPSAKPVTHQKKKDLVISTCLTLELIIDSVFDC